MEADVALAVAQALSSKLSVFHEISGAPLRTVWQVEKHGSLDQVILDFGRISLIVNARPEDDSIDFKAAKTADLLVSARKNVSRSSFWEESIDLPFGWGWVTINQQGYCDGLLLSFAGIEPQILMNVMASSIKLKRVSSAS